MLRDPSRNPGGWLAYEISGDECYEPNENRSAALLATSMVAGCLTFWRAAQRWREALVGQTCPPRLSYTSAPSLSPLVQADGELASFKDPGRRDTYREGVCCCGR